MFCSKQRESSSCFHTDTITIRLRESGQEDNTNHSTVREWFSRYLLNIIRIRTRTPATLCPGGGGGGGGGIVEKELCTFVFLTPTVEMKYYYNWSM